MERLDGAVRGALRGAGVPDAGALADVTRLWPVLVGDAIARSMRDIMSLRWVRTEETYRHANPKRVYYLSMEFLIGRMLVNNILNLGVEKLVREFRKGPRAVDGDRKSTRLNSSH